VSADELRAFYKADWKQANEWLNANAPPYVLSYLSEWRRVCDRMLEADDKFKRDMDDISKYLAHAPPKADEGGVCGSCGASNQWVERCGNCDTGLAKALTQRE